MGWLTDVWKKMKGAPPSELTYIENVNVPSGFPGVGDVLDPDECYIELYVESCRLEEARKFATRFNGIVYSFVSLARQGESNAQLAAVSKPEKLTDVDPNAISNVITVSKQMMGAVPWLGGTLSLQIGLFSVKSGNVLTPVLEYVTKVSSAAGISFVGAVKPFLPLITEGMDLIAGQQADTKLEVAVDTDITPRVSGVHAIVAAPRNTLDPAKLVVDSTDRKLKYDGKPLESGYCVFSIRRALQKADFGEIPELKEKYAAFQVALKANKRKDADDALTAFRLATIASPDLITKDAQRLVAKAREKFDAAFPSGALPESVVDHDVEPLAALNLYN